MYLWTTYPVFWGVNHIYECEQQRSKEGQSPNSLLRELVAALERTGSFGFCGAGRVLSTYVMDPLLLSMGIKETGFPCLSDMVKINTAAKEKISIAASKWPRDVDGIPRFASKRVVIYNYSQSTYDVSAFWSTGLFMGINSSRGLKDLPREWLIGQDNIVLMFMNISTLLYFCSWAGVQLCCVQSYGPAYAINIVVLFMNISTTCLLSQGPLLLILILGLADSWQWILPYLSSTLFPNASLNISWMVSMCSPPLQHHCQKRSRLRSLLQHMQLMLWRKMRFMQLRKASRDSSMKTSPRQIEMNVDGWIDKVPNSRSSWRPLTPLTTLRVPQSNCFWSSAHQWMRFKPSWRICPELMCMNGWGAFMGWCHLGTPMLHLQAGVLAPL